MRQIITIGFVVLLLACCGGDSSDRVAMPATQTANAETTTTAAAASESSPPSTTLVRDLTIQTNGGLATQLTSGLRYHTGGAPFRSISGRIDVISPVDGNDYPTVVVFHGGPSTVGKGWHRLDAQMIAEQGLVVFLPDWGHHDSAATGDLGVAAGWELSSREVKCAVAYARNTTAEFGGDPAHITLYGLSAGGNAVLSAGFSDADPLDTCSVPGPAGAVQALVPIDADWLLGGHGDAVLQADPESFYSAVPWRSFDGSQDFRIDVMIAENADIGPYNRSVAPDPATSWLSYRHVDVDLVADLVRRGYLADGAFSLKESAEYAFEILRDAGYDVTLTVLQGASHDVWGDDGRATVVETVVNAGRG